MISGMKVVSYRNSTSNHNQGGAIAFNDRVVSYRNSTSNHNLSSYPSPTVGLYLIEILHQTTTRTLKPPGRLTLYLIEILHQTTTTDARSTKFAPLYLIEILHQTTTGDPGLAPGDLLYLIEILHQTTTTLWILRKLNKVVSYRNSTSNHNPISPGGFAAAVVSYRNSTSNHNQGLTRCWRQSVVSYRNSTSNHNSAGNPRPYYPLYLIEILHQTTTLLRLLCQEGCCILSKFYIKPQPILLRIASS